MSRSEKYDDLDEMSVPQIGTDDLEDDIQIGKQAKTSAKKRGKKSVKPPLVQQREEEARRKQWRTIGIVAACFAVLLAALIAVGVIMTGRLPQEEPPVETQKATPAEGKTVFYNEGNIPEMSDAGVKGMLKEAYYTVDGDLAVTLNLSNGTDKELEVIRVAARIFNDADETVAQQTVDESHFQNPCKVPANGYGELYFEIDQEYVVLRNDPLTTLGTTLEIGSVPTDGSTVTMAQPQGAQVGDGPKDIANNRTYYENLGNQPELSTEGVKASVIRARYTNDGSLVLDMSFSNGTTNQQKLTKVDVLLQNGAGATITDYAFDLSSENYTVEVGSHAQYQLTVDTASVQIKDDALDTLTCTVSVSADGIGAVTTTESADTATTAAAA